MNNTERAAAYLAKMPPAIAGNGGHRATFAAACRLVEFGLSLEHAAPLLAAWNETHCQPPWTETELRHKLADAFKRSHPKPEFMAVGAAAATVRASAQKPSVKTADTQTKRAISNASASNFQKTELATLRSRFQPGTSQEMAALATLRGLSQAGIALATARGLLRFGRYHGADGWIVLDASHRNGCARRMDGAEWSQGCKSRIFKGACARWPIGISEAQPFHTILFCEGAPDLLAACHFIALQGREADCAPVAMLSATCPILVEALPLFRGKRVRIYSHNDESGYRATLLWAAQLGRHNADVDAFSFAGIRDGCGETVKDFNDFATAQANEETESLQVNLLP